MKDDLRGWRLGRVVTVVDRGCSSEENLRCLTRAGGHWIAGEKLRDGSADARAALSRQGRYRRVRDNLRVKDVRVGAGDAARRFIVCHNPEEAERDRAKRDDAIARLTAELERIAAARARTRSREQRSRRDAEEAAHTKAECALRDHRTLGRYLRQTSAGRLVVDRAKIAVEARLDGKFLLSTSDPDLCAEDVALGYKSLLEAERGFRDLKTTLELRPVFRRRSAASTPTCCCAGSRCCSSASPRTAGQTWRRIALELGRVHEVTLAGDVGAVTQTTELTDAQRGIFRALDIAPPPRITHLDPA